VTIVADPVFTSDDPRVRTEPGRRPSIISEKRDPDIDHDKLTRSITDTEQNPKEGIHLARLLYSRLEADTVASVFPKGQAYEALNFDASRATVMSPSLGDSRILHLATHGFLDSKDPELSGLVFSMVDRRGQPQVGFYGLEDIFNASLPVGLVVLSACQTALGQEVDGEGLVGLTWGFLYAGAKTVIASLWKVNDASTAELMRLLYQAMEVHGMPPAAALRWAQLTMSRESRWASPYYWAGFTVQGDWRSARAN
jgi:CHAT domain-containing protein